VTGLDATDRAALTDLVHRYAACVDDRDLDGVAALFTEDGVLARPGPGTSLEPATEVVGRAEIRRAMEVLAGIDRTVHEVTGLVLTGTGADTATGRVAGVAHHVTGDSDHVWHLTYRDDYRRVDGAWLLARRALTIVFIEDRPVRRRRP
jgi:ketosteroid isomerase-like protein